MLAPIWSNAAMLPIPTFLGRKIMFYELSILPNTEVNQTEYDQHIAKAYFKYRAIPVPKLHSRIMTFETTQFEFGMTAWHGSPLAVPHGSSTTWLQTACRYELNS